MKRYEFLVKREKANETWAKYQAEELTHWVYQAHQRGVLPPEDYYELLDQRNEATEREWEATLRVCQVEMNLRKAHVSFCKVRQVKTVVLNLAQVSAQYVNTKRLQHDPPGLCSCSNVLATCHASNAPGLSPIAMNYWQVRPRE